jgi:hypothetical protein
VIVHEGAPQDEDVEDLVRVQPDVELAGEPPLGHPQRVQHRPHDVQQPHQDQPAERLLADLVEPALDYAVVDGRDDAAQAEGHEDGRPERPPPGLGELVPQADHDAGDAQRAHHRQVHHLRPEVAVEAVVDPRDERTHYQHGDAAVVQFREELADELRVTVDCVEHERHPQADYRAGEERAEHDLLLQLDLHGGTHQEEYCDRYESHTSQEVGPDVGRLRVQTEDALEACPEAGQRRPVAEYEKIVVLEPGWQVAEVTDRPACLDHLPDHVFGLTGGIVGQSCDVQLVTWKGRWKQSPLFLSDETTPNKK